MKRIYSIGTLVLCLSGLSQLSKAQLVTQTLNFTGAVQTVTIPGCVPEVTITAYGAQGANGASTASGAVGGTGGLGAMASGVYTFSTSQPTLNVYVGGAGSGSLGGFNGGGDGGLNTNAGAGGGASDVRINGTALSDRIIVAGGGGGGGSAGCVSSTITGGNGGAGGGGNGTAGVNSQAGGGGAAATGSLGGAPGGGCPLASGTVGVNGSSGQGGNGGNSVLICSARPTGGGGGGGFIGGGGGGGGTAGTTSCTLNDTGAGGGGAGGTNYLALLTNSATNNGVQSGNGLVIISYSIGAPPSITATGAATICAGASATLTASGANSFSWSTAQTTSSIVVTPSITTTYTVTGSNGAGCSNTAAVTVSVNARPSLSLTSAPASGSICSGSTVSLTVSGADTYIWNTTATTTSITSTPTTNTIYSLTATSAASLGACTNTIATTITVVATPTIGTSSNQTVLCPGNSAIITVTSTGSPTFSWNTGATTNTISVSPSVTTNYTVQANNSGCGAIRVHTLSVSPSLSLTISPASGSICSGSTATLSASGANTYTWSTNVNTTSITANPLTTTLYSVNATSAASLGACSLSASITLTVVATPTIGTSSSPTVLCPGNSAIITVTSTGSPTFSWNTSATTNTISVSPTVTTNYTVQANNNGCGAIRVHTLTVAATPTLTAPNRTVCTGRSATLTVTGTPGTLTYSWSTAQTGTSSIVITPTTQIAAVELYTVTGTSTANCSASQVITLTINQTPTVSSTQSTNSLCTGSTATLTGTGSGATTYTWTGGVTNGASFSPTIANTTASAAVNYTVTGTSALGCTNSAVATITVVLTPTFSPIANPVVFCDGNSSTLSVNAAIPLSLTWTPTGANTNSIVITPTAGTYTYVVNKQNGVCVDTKSVIVTVNALPGLVASATPSIICVSNQTTSLFAVGGTNYTWTPYGGTVQTAIVTASANTTFTLRGSNGVCTNTTTVLVNTNPNPTVNIVPSQSVICRGQSATLTANGASNGYSWTPTNTTGSAVVVSPTTATSYTVVGTNSFGCTNTKIQTINVNPLPVFSATSAAAGGNTMVCLPGAGPSTATLTASNGANCTYSWSSGAQTASTIVVPPTNPTIYTVTATQTITTCQAFRTLTINIFEPTISVAGSFSACFGGAVTLTANTTPPPQVNPITSYTWSGGNLTTPIAIQIANLSPTTQTTYSVIGRTQPPGSNLSCTTATFVTISIYLNPTVTAVSIPTLICKGAISALTGTGALTYQWSENQQIADTIRVSPIAAVNIYTVVGTDANGCSATTTVQVKTSTCPGYEEFEKNAESIIQIFPNPNNGQFIIKGSERATLILVNQLGQRVKEVELTDANNFSSEVNNLQNGIYFISNGRSNHKIIVNQ
jgi:hypothetical protein